MLIKKAWYVKALPQHIVVETEESALRKFRMTPYRTVTAAELSTYRGYHPDGIGADELGAEIKFYGLEQSRIHL